MYNYREFFADQTIYLQGVEECLIFRCYSDHVVLNLAADPGWLGCSPYLARVLQDRESCVLKPLPRNELPLGCEIFHEVPMSHRDWFRSMFRFTTDYRKLLLAIKEGVYENTGNFYYEDYAENTELAYKFCDEFPTYEREIRQFMAEQDIA